MSNEKMREEFEKCWRECGNCEEDDIYNTNEYEVFKFAWKASRYAHDGYCIVPSETIKKAYALASSVCGDCYAGEDTESLLANQLTKEISKSEYWMGMK